MMASGAKEDPTPVEVESPDSGLLLQETVPIGERDGFGTLVNVAKGICDNLSSALVALVSFFAFFCVSLFPQLDP